MRGKCGGVRVGGRSEWKERGGSGQEDCGGLILSDAADGFVVGILIAVRGELLFILPHGLQ